MDDLEPAPRERREPRVKRVRRVGDVGATLQVARAVAELGDADLFETVRPLAPAPRSPPAGGIPVREHPEWHLLTVVAGQASGLDPEDLLDLPDVARLRARMKGVDEARGDAADELAAARAALWTAVDELSELEADARLATQILSNEGAVAQARALQWILDEGGVYVDGVPDYVRAWYTTRARAPLPKGGQVEALRAVAGREAARILRTDERDLPAEGPEDAGDVSELEEDESDEEEERVLAARRRGRNRGRPPAIIPVGRADDEDDAAIAARRRNQPAPPAPMPQVQPASEDAWMQPVRAAIARLERQSIAATLSADYADAEDPERAWADDWSRAAAEQMERAQAARRRVLDAAAAVVDASWEADEARAGLDAAMRVSPDAPLPLVPELESAVQLAYSPVAQHIRHLPLAAILLGPRTQMSAFADAVAANYLLAQARYPRAYRPVWLLEDARRRQVQAVEAMARLRVGTRM